MTLSGTPASEPGRVDREVGGVAERADPVRADALRLEALPPDVGRLRREVVEGQAFGFGASSSFTHGRKLAGIQVREGQQQVPHVALRVEDEAGDAREQRFLDQHDREPGLAGPGHADDDAMRREVARLDHERVRARLACLRVEAETELKIGHRPSLERGSLPSR